MKTGKLLAFGCFAAIGVGLMSCSKADVFDSNAANELKKSSRRETTLRILSRNMAQSKASLGI